MEWRGSAYETWGRLPPPLQDRLRTNGLAPENVPGDGNCLFNAVSLQVSVTHEFLRFQVKELIEFDEEMKRRILPTLPATTTWEQYLELLGRDREWAGEESLIALSLITGRRMIVIQPPSEADCSYWSNGDRQPGLPPAFQPDFEDIYLLYNGSTHYDALIRATSSPGPCLPISHDAATATEGTLFKFLESAIAQLHRAPSVSHFKTLLYDLDAQKERIATLSPPSVMFAFYAQQRAGKSTLINTLTDQPRLLVTGGGGYAVTSCIVDIGRDSDTHWRGEVVFRDESQWKLEVWERTLLQRSSVLKKLLESIMGQQLAHAYFESLENPKNPPFPNLRDFLTEDQRKLLGTKPSFSSPSFEEFRQQLHQYSVTSEFVNRDSNEAKPATSVGPLCSFVSAVRVRGPLGLVTRKGVVELPPAVTFIDMPGEESEETYRVLSARQFVQNPAFSTSSPRSTEARERQVGFLVLGYEWARKEGPNGMAFSALILILKTCFTNWDSEVPRRDLAKSLKAHLEQSGEKELGLIRLRRCIFVITQSDEVTAGEKDAFKTSFQEYVDEYLPNVEIRTELMKLQRERLFFTAVSDSLKLGINDLGEHIWKTYSKYYTRTFSGVAATVLVGLSECKAALTSKLQNSNYSSVMEAAKASLDQWSQSGQREINALRENLTGLIALRNPLPMTRELDECLDRLETPPLGNNNPHGSTVRKHLTKWLYSPSTAEIPEVAKHRLVSFAHPLLRQWARLFAGEHSLIERLCKLDCTALEKLDAKSAFGGQVRSMLQRSFEERDQKFRKDADEIFSSKLEAILHFHVGQIDALYRDASAALEYAKRVKGRAACNFLLSNRQKFDDILRNFQRALLMSLKGLCDRIEADIRGVHQNLKKLVENADNTASEDEHLEESLQLLASLIEGAEKLQEQAPPEKVIFKQPQVMARTTSTSKLEQVALEGGRQVMKKRYASAALLQVERWSVKCLMRHYADPPCAQLVDVHGADNELYFDYLPPLGLRSLSCQELLRHVLISLQKAHQASVIHGDLKLEHLCGLPVRFVDWDNAVDVSKEDGPVTFNLQLRGNRANLPPELQQCDSYTYPTKKQAKSVDIWSAGYAILCYIRGDPQLKLPDALPDFIDDTVSNASESLVPSSLVSPLCRCLKRMLCRLPEERASAEDLLASSFLTGLPTTIDEKIAGFLRRSGWTSSTEISQASHLLATPSAEIRAAFDRSDMEAFLRRWWDMVLEIPANADKWARGPRHVEGYYHGLVHLAFCAILGDKAPEAPAAGFYGSELRVGDYRIDAMVATPNGRIWLLEFKVADSPTPALAVGALRQMIWPYGSGSETRGRCYWQLALDKKFRYENISMIAMVFPKDKQRRILPIIKHIDLSDTIPRNALDQILKLQKAEMQERLDQLLSELP